MKNKSILWLTVLALIVLIGGASVLYGKLSSQMGEPQLASQENPNEKPIEEEQTEAQEEGQVDDGEDTEEEVKTLAPDFTVYDLEGNAVKLSDFRGKPVVLNFWASWCGPCKSEMPDFEEAYQEMQEEVSFVMVNVTDGSWETVESASSFIEESGYSFPVFYDTDGSAAVAYGVSSIPATYFIDDEGCGIAYRLGALDMETLKKGIEMISH